MGREQPLLSALAATFLTCGVESCAAAVAGTAEKHPWATWHGGRGAGPSLGSPGRSLALLVNRFYFASFKGWEERGREDLSNVV